MCSTLSSGPRAEQLATRRVGRPNIRYGADRRGEAPAVVHGGVEARDPIEMLRQLVGLVELFNANAAGAVRAPCPCLAMQPALAA
jgi:hypothetical protein